MPNANWSLKHLSRRPLLFAVTAFLLACATGMAVTGGYTFFFVFLREFGLADEERVFVLSSRTPGSAHEHQALPRMAVELVREEARTVEKVGEYVTYSRSVKTPAWRGMLTGCAGSQEAFELVSGGLLTGRMFTAEEQQGTGAPVALVSERIWREQYQAERALPEAVILIGKTAYRVIGVVDGEKVFPPGTDIWTPLAQEAGRLRNAGQTELFGSVLRLRRGSGIEDLEKELGRIGGRLWPGEQRILSAVPVREFVYGKYKRPVVFLILGVAAFAILCVVSCMAVLLASSESRWREFAIRRALGARAGHMFGMVASESVALGVLSGVMAIGIAHGCGRVLAYSLRQPAAGSEAGGMLPAGVLAFCPVVSLLICLAMGVVLALRVSSQAGEPADWNAWLHAGSVSSNPRRWTLLIMGQVACSALLLTVCLGFALAYRTLVSTRIGFETAEVLTFEMWPSEPNSTERGLAEVYDRTLAALSKYGRVRAAGLISDLPVGGRKNSNLVFLGGGGESEGRTADVKPYGGAYFEALRIPLLSGELPEATMRGGCPRCVVVSQTAAKAWFGGRSPIGSEIGLGQREERYRVSAVVGDVRRSFDSAPSPTVYVPFPDGLWNRMTVTVRTQGSPEAAANDIRAIIRQIDAGALVIKVTSLEEALANTVAEKRMQVRIATVLSVAAIFMALAGMYAVLAFQVFHGRRELALRLCLGAPRARIAVFLMRKVLQGMMAGLAAGYAVMALVADSPLGSLANIQQDWPVVYLRGAVLLLVAALPACVGPVIQSLRLDPASLLRE